MCPLPASKPVALRIWAVSSILLVLAMSPGTAVAACTSSVDLKQFGDAVSDHFLCAARVLRGSDAGPCRSRPAPACASEQFAAVVDLLGGFPAGAVPRSVARCQISAYRGARKFLSRRISERREGRRRQRRSRRALRVGGRCLLAPGGARPAFGGRCGEIEQRLDSTDGGRQLERCLRPALEEIAGSVLGLPPLAPNVIVIVTDDQNPLGIDFMPRTLSLIAERGMTFENAFTTTPICAPSRAGILTGQHATTHGVIANGIGTPSGEILNGAQALDDSSTLAVWFQNAGYRTAMFGKYLNSYQLVSPVVPMGWEEWRVFPADLGNYFGYELNENGSLVQYGDTAADYSTDVLADFALRFMERISDEPFLIFFTPSAPHLPSEPAPRHAGSLAGTPPWRPPNWNQQDLTGKPSWLRFFKASPALLAQNDRKAIDRLESLLAVDEAVEALSDKLDELGLADNTIVVFTTDHGLSWGEHAWIGKQVPYEETIRVPMIWRYPLVLPAATHRSEMVLNIDIAPTLVSLAGVPTPQRFDGRDIAELLAGSPWREEFIVQHFTGGFIVPPWVGLRGTRYKYIRHPAEAEEVYDLVEDPWEFTNIALDPANAALVGSLSQRLDALIASIGQ